MTSNLKTLHDRIKRGLSEDVSVAPSFEAARFVISPMKSINKTLFPSNAIENPTRFLKTIKTWLFPYCTKKIRGVVYLQHINLKLFQTNRLANIVIFG